MSKHDPLTEALDKIFGPKRALIFNPNTGEIIQLEQDEKQGGKEEPPHSWFCTEPGILALRGTRFRIQYHADDNRGRFHLYEGYRFCGCARRLDLAKDATERMQKDIEEIGAA